MCVACVGTSCPTICVAIWCDHVLIKFVQSEEMCHHKVKFSIFDSNTMRLNTNEWWLYSIKTLCILFIFHILFCLRISLSIFFDFFLCWTFSFCAFCLASLWRLLLLFCHFSHSHFYGCHSIALKIVRVHSLCGFYFTTQLLCAQQQLDQK